MKNLLFVALIGLAIYSYKTDLFSSNAGAFDQNGNPQVWVFTANRCPTCADAINILDRRVDYMEFNTSEEIGKERLIDAGGGNSFPLIVIGNKKVLGNDEMQIVSALAEVMGDDALTASERRVMNGHFYDDDTPAVVMYGASWCGYCKKMRNYFTEHNIQYTELDAEHEAQDDYITLKGHGFPLIYIGYRRIHGANISLVEKTIRELNI